MAPSESNDKIDRVDLGLIKTNIRTIETEASLQKIDDLYSID
jgi:hypothetical protein